MKHFLMMAGVLLGVSAFAVTIPVEQLRPAHHMKNVEIKDGVFSAEATGNDPFFVIGDFPKFDAAENQVVKFDLKVGKGSSKTCQLFWTTDAEPKFDEKKTFRVDIPKFDEWVTYEVDLIGQPGWQGTITGFRFDPVSNVDHKSFSIRNIEFKPFTVKNLPMNRWGSNDQLKNCKVLDDGTLSAGLIVGKNDPILVGPSFPGLPAGKIRYVKFDLLVPEGAGKAAQIFFRTEDMKDFRGDTLVNFEVIPDGKFHSYVLDFSGNAKWTGKIIQLRLDPTGHVSKEGNVQLRNFRIDTEN